MTIEFDLAVVHMQRNTQMLINQVIIKISIEYAQAL